MTAGGPSLAERVLSAHAGRAARAGDIVVCEADLILGTDGSTPMALDYFEALGGGPVAEPSRVLLARDHYAPPTSPSTLRFHERMQAFARQHDIELLRVGDGIGFLVALEEGRVRPGDLVVGADSHTLTCGAVGAFGTGIGSADLAVAMRTGRVWLRVPATWRVILEGEPAAGVGAKDVALELVRRLGSDGAPYVSLEFEQQGAEALPLEERVVLCNMAAEVGAKAGMFPAPDAAEDEGVGTSDRRPVRYARELRLEVSVLEPMVALPHDPAHGVPVSEAAGSPVDFVFLGTCTGGRLHDFREARRVLEAGGGIAAGVTVVVTPPTWAVRDALAADGTLAALETMGAMITETGCGPCCGTSPVVPPSGARVISTANRNFRGRMGPGDVSIHLASPATCAASAARGRITDPREVA